MNNAPTHVLSTPEKTIFEATCCAWYMNIPNPLEIMSNLIERLFRAGLPHIILDLTLFSNLMYLLKSL